MVQFIPAKDDWANAFREIGAGVSQGYMSGADEKALKKSIGSLPGDATPRQILDAITNTRTYSPESKQQVLKNYLGVAEFEELKRKAQQQEEIAREKNQIAAFKEVNKQQGKEQNQQLINQVRESPGFQEQDEVQQYKTLTQAGVSPADAEREAKLKATQLNRQSTEVNKSYDAQKDFIDEVTNRHKAFEVDTKPRLQLLSKLATDEELIEPTANVIRERLGIPLGALDNPNNELFQKTALDLLKGLPESYGNKILKVEVDNFLRTIPTLENSVEGRRMIASNLLKLGEMKEVYYNEMRQMQKSFLDQNKPFPKDFEQRVFDQVKPQIDKVNNEFIKQSEIKYIPPGTVPFFSPMGEIEFIPKDQEEWAIQNGGKRIW